MTNLVFWIFLLSSAVICFYWVFIYSRIGLYRTDKKQPTQPEPVSVIIAAHNEEKNLNVLIPALLRQHYDQFEVIVALDRSSDGSFDYLSEIQKQTDRLNVINIDKVPPGVSPKKNALTHAVEMAKHKKLLFTDADCIPAGDRWIEKMQSAFTGGKEIILGYSPYRREKGLLNFFIRFETLMTAVQYFSFALSGRPYMGVGRNLAYTKGVFVENGGFGHHMYVLEGDDDLFINAAATSDNTGVMIDPEAHTVSIPEQSFGKWFRQKVRHLHAGKKYTFGNKVRLGTFIAVQLMFYFSFVPVIISGKFITVALLIYVTKTLISALILRAATYRLGDRNEWYLFPFSDVLYFAYLSVTGFVSLVTRKIKWA